MALSMHGAPFGSADWDFWVSSEDRVEVYEILDQFDLHEQYEKAEKNLVEFIRTYNAFSVGIAVYPEGHVESPDIDKDLEFTKQKIDAGADFGVTQMFFDNRFFYEFMDRAEKIGITIPIFPGFSRDLETVDVKIQQE